MHWSAGGIHLEGGQQAHTPRLRIVPAGLAGSGVDGPHRPRGFQTGVTRYIINDVMWRNSEFGSIDDWFPMIAQASARWPHCPRTRPPRSATPARRQSREGKQRVSRSDAVDHLDGERRDIRQPGLLVVAEAPALSARDDHFRTVQVAGGLGGELLDVPGCDRDAGAAPLSGSATATKSARGYLEIT